MSLYNRILSSQQVTKNQNKLNLCNLLGCEEKDLTQEFFIHMQQFVAATFHATCQLTCTQGVIHHRDILPNVSGEKSKLPQPSVSVCTTYN